MSNTAEVQGQTKKLWSKVLSNAGSLSIMLGERYAQVESLESDLKEQITLWTNKLHLPDRFLTAPAALNEINLNIKNLYEAIGYLDTDDAYSILDLIHEVLDVLKKILPQLLKIEEQERQKMEEILDTFEDLLNDAVDLLMYGYGDEHSIAEWAALIKETIENFTDQLNQLGVSDDITDAINKATAPILNIILLAVAQKAQSEEETDAYWDDEDTDFAEEPAYQRVFEPETERVIQNVTQNFNKIYTEIEQIPVVGRQPIQETDIQGIWEQSITRFRSLDLDGYDDIEYAFENIRENLDATFDYIIGKYPKTQDIVNDTIRPYVIKWLTLPDDFRPNNFVEVIHVVVQNIQFSLRTSLSNVGPVQQLVLPIVNKLEYILSQVDNDDFKILIMPKEEPVIREIYIPDLLDPEEAETEPEKPKLLENENVEVQLNAEENTKTEPDSNEEPEPQRLTYGMVIDYLCFDKEKGATAKMKEDLADVIHDLYYRDWLISRIDYLEDELMSLFDKDTYLGYWEEIKAKLLDEKGLNLGEFVAYLIDKAVSVFNGLIDFVKETIQYVIEEVFKLIKAIIEFLKEVDLPENTKKLLKKIPLFEAMPDGVTLLHVIAAIPYTIYTEFMNFKPQMQAA